MYDYGNDNELEQLLRKIKDEGRAARNRKTAATRNKVIVGVAVAACLTVGSYFYFDGARSLPDNVMAVVDGEEVQHEKPILRLARKENVVIDDQYGYITSANDKTVSISTDTEKTVHYKRRQNTSVASLPEWDEAVVPRKSFLKLVLEDGTKVWINSSSSLEFPRFFTGEERRVKLNGEAYMEVAHNPDKPFIVETPSMQVRVLGTTLNICDYQTEGHMATTVVAEGSVMVISEGNNPVKLVPGEQVVLENGTMRKRNVDVEMYTSWIDGKFMFDNSALADISRQISRWYDQEILFEDDRLGNIHFSGVMYMNRPLEELIERIESTSNARFVKTDNGYIITSK